LKGTALSAALIVILAAAAPSQGQIFRYMAFGDSITKGRLEFDPTGQGGYPGRLDELLSCAPPNCEVINQGKDGEITAQGVTRIETLLTDEAWDIVLLMEGTNDVFNNISNNTIEANLATIDDKARNHGVDTLHASIIHLDPESTGGMSGSKVAAVENLRTRIQNLAAARNRYFADPWSPLCPNQACFDQHYHDPPGAVGHPDPSGFDIMAGVFRASIQSHPVPGVPDAIGPIGTIDNSTPNFTWTREVDATWYELHLLDSVGTTLSLEWIQHAAACGNTLCGRNLGFLADGNYTWEIRARNPRGRSAWRSTPFTVQTLLPPTVAAPSAPQGVIADVEPTFQWTRETPEAATLYRLEVADTGGIILATDYSTMSICIADTCAVDAFAGNPLAPGGYTWRVRGSNAAGAGPWSEVLAFEVNPDLLFYDGFESGDTSAWSSITP
jgi:lysophospholipase L1-like esterase